MTIALLANQLTVYTDDSATAGNEMKVLQGSGDDRVRRTALSLCHLRSVATMKS